jgi:succinate dehydrogenase / fumarate reductase flavoprotein subunit
MGGIEVDPDTGASSVPGLFAVGEVTGGMHGSNRLGGNSLGDLLVFGQRTGAGAATYAAAATKDRPTVPEEAIDAVAATAQAPFEHEGGDNPYTLHQELQQVMNDLVGIIRSESEMREAVDKLAGIRDRAAHLSVEGQRQFNPGWHLALDLRNMLQVSECVARSALERQESRGGHTRDDFPAMDAKWRGVNLACHLDLETGTVHLTRQQVPTIPDDLMHLFERSELEKYFTPEELAQFDDLPDAQQGEDEQG